MKNPVKHQTAFTTYSAKTRRSALLSVTVRSATTCHSNLSFTDSLLGFFLHLNSTVRLLDLRYSRLYCRLRRSDRSFAALHETLPAESPCYIRDQLNTRTSSVEVYREPLLHLDHHAKAEPCQKLVILVGQASSPLSFPFPRPHSWEIPRASLSIQCPCHQQLASLIMSFRPDTALRRKTNANR